MESSGHMLHACLAQGCFGMKVRSEREHLKEKLNITCVVRKKTGNLVLEGDRQMLLGRHGSLFWLQIRRQDANGTANFVGLHSVLPGRGMVNTKSFL